MAGVDTVRGIAFQHAYAIHLALDAVESLDAQALTIEGSADVVDVEVVRRASPTRSIYQIKARREPYTWPPGELAEIVHAWVAAGGGVNAPLCFVSDGPASPDTANKLKPALERARSGTLSEDDRDYLRGLGIDDALAAHVQLATRSESTGPLLAMAENRLRRLLGLAGPVGPDDPERAVDRLFRLFAVEGGNARIERRTFSRSDLAEALGLDLAVIDVGDEWTVSVAEEYRAAIAAGRSPHALVELAALLDPTATTPALALVVTPDAARGGVQEPAVALIDLARGAGLCGAAGTGKTTTARQMAEHAARAGHTAVVVAVGGYRRGDLHRRVRRTLEGALARPLVPSAATAAVAQPDSTLILDGLTGLSSEQLDALADDVRDVLERVPELRTIVADRDRAFARRFELATYTLSPLGSDERLTVAAGLVDNPAAVVADLEHRLGDVVDNPLLFVMALALTRVGMAANGRAAIFDGFIKGLRERTTATTVDDSDMAALRLATVALTGEERFAADRYWWLATLAEALDQLRAAGIYEVGARTAEAVFLRLLETGLLFEDDLAASVSLLHDAFRDYLTSVALARGEADLPRPVSAEWEQACELLAEQGGLTPDHCRALAADNPVATTRVARFDTHWADPSLTGELARTLAAAHLGDPPCGVDFGVVIVRAADRIYALVAPGEEDTERTVAEASALAEVSPAVVALRPDASSLALGAALWREFLKQMTAAEPPALHRPVPTSRAELAEAVARQFREQQQELVSLATRLVPTLADRVVDAIGWSGFRAHVGEQETTTPLPGQQMTYHPIQYSLGGKDVVIDVSDDPDAGYGARATAEWFVEQTPRSVALKALVDELHDLLPEIG